MKLDGKHILITGASSGIGEATAHLLVAEGARVTLVARREMLLQSICNQLNLTRDGNRYIAIDLSKQEAVSSLANVVSAVDGIVNAAGIVFSLPIKFLRKKHFENVWNINTLSPMLLTAELLQKKKINNGASLVFISSISTTYPYQGGAIYVSSKAALEAYSKTVALELAPKKIRSNVVSPALVKTEILEATIQYSNAEKFKEYEASYPFGFGEPEDIANAILFFLSDQSKWITGQNLIMDGGLTLRSKK
jgi:predicted outer membrane repeat protein